MWIESLTLHNCRSLKKVNVKLSPQLNFIIGKNASGKTSFLESLNILSTGKSFRTSHISDVISYDESFILVSAVVRKDNSKISIGIEKTTKATKIRINKQDVYSQSKLSLSLPVTTIHPDSVDLITGSPIHRRAFLDWIAFYNFPEFHSIWKDYRHILKQRNLCLKEAKHRYILEEWTNKLIELQPKIHQYRIETINIIRPLLNKICKKLLGNTVVDIELLSGFTKDVLINSENLKEFYTERERYDLKMQRTTAGVHRADLRITLDSNSAKSCGSRGQLKLLVISLLLAQSSAICKSKNKGVLIIDDLAAELDNKNKEKLLDYLSTLNQQLIITSTKEIKIKDKENKMFHVKHGDLFEI